MPTPGAFRMVQQIPPPEKMSVNPPEALLCRHSCVCIGGFTSTAMGCVCCFYTLPNTAMPVEVLSIDQASHQLLLSQNKAHPHRGCNGFTPPRKNSLGLVYTRKFSSSRLATPCSVEAALLARWCLFPQGKGTKLNQ